MATQIVDSKEWSVRQYAVAFSSVLAMFACLIIRTFQLVFSAGTVFFSHNKSIETVFRLVFSAKRTGPLSLYLLQVFTRSKMTMLKRKI